MAKHIYIDFETFYDTANKYSLRSMPNSRYVRSPRFQPHGMSIAVGDNDPVWVQGADDIRAVLCSINWPEYDVVGYNLAFDGLIMTHYYSCNPRAWVDVLGMARAVIGARTKSHGLDAVSKIFGLSGKAGAGAALKAVNGVDSPTLDQLRALGEYCNDDVRLTREVFKRLQPAFPQCEYDILSWTTEMTVHPRIELDPAPLRELLVEEKADKAAKVKASGFTRAQIASNVKFAECLRTLGVTPPEKTSAVTGKTTFAFAKQDEAFTALLEHPNNDVVALVEARLAVKSTIKQSRANALLAMAGEGPWALQLNYSGAMQTQRLSGAGGVNPQNLNRNQPGKVSLLRKALRASAGRKLVVVDLSQIELRVNCAVSGQVDVLDRLTAGEDEYSLFASRIYGRTITKKDKQERNVGKVGKLSLGYGAGAATFRTMLRGYGIILPLDECARIVKLYRALYPYISRSWGMYDQMLGDMLMRRMPVLPVELNAPITMKHNGFVLPRGLHVTYPNMCMFDWEHKSRVDPVTYRYLDGSTNVWGGDVARRDDCSLAYTNMRKPIGLANVYGPKMCGNICQSLARDVNMDATQRTRQLLHTIDPTARIVLSVHDELVIDTDASCADAMLDMALTQMQTPPVWWASLPVDAEGAIGQNYAEAK